MTEELKRCPFCGAEPMEQDAYLSRIMNPDKTVPDVACPNGHTMMMPRETWNTRLSHSAEKEALIEALEKIVSLNQERHWTATGDSPETRWVTRDGPYAKLARSTLLSMRNNGNG